MTTRNTLLAGLICAGVSLTSMAAPPDCPGQRAVDGDDCDWSGTATRLGGVSTYSDGEFIHSDFIHDDYGPNLDTVESGEADPPQPITGIWPNPQDPTDPRLGATGNNTDTRFRHSGDFGYPPASPDSQDFYDVADIHEFRMATTDEAVYFLIRLGALINPDDAVIGIGIDADRDATTGAGQWPRGANMPQQLGYDYFLTVWGTHAELIDYTGETPVKQMIPAAANTDANFIEVAMPRPPDSQEATWRLYVGSGLWDAGARQWQQVRPTTTRSFAPSVGGPIWPNIFNLLFRPQEPNSWYRDVAQADDLAKRDIADDHADVDLAKLDEGVSAPAPEATGLLNPQYETVPIGDGEGVEATSSVFGSTNFVYKGTRQPYTLVLPSDTFDEPGPRRFMFFFHCLNCTHNIWPVGVEDADTRGQTHVYKDQRLDTDHIQSVVDDFDMVVAGSLQRGEDGAGDHGWRFEEKALRDVQRTILERDGLDLDPNRFIYAGQSMGAITTHRMMTLYPDELAAAVAYSGYPLETEVPARLENIRNLLYVAINGDTGLDTGSNISGRDAAQALTERGYEHFYMEYLGRAHDFNLVDESWPIVKGLLADRVRDPNPARVTFTRDASLETPEFDLVHDSAYWVSDLTFRQNSQTGTIDATALPLANKLPKTATLLKGNFVNPENGNAAFVSWLAYEDLSNRGLSEFQRGWRPVDVSVEPVPVEAPENAGANGFVLTATGFDGSTLDTTRMGISTRDTVSGEVEVDTRYSLGLTGDWTGSETATIDGETIATTLDGDRLVVAIPSGEHELVIAPPGRRGRGAGR